jgi:hypothetical protein
MLDGLLLAAQGTLVEAVDVLREAAAGLRALGLADAAEAASAALLEAAYWSGRLDETEREGARFAEP